MPLFLYGIRVIVRRRTPPSRVLVAILWQSRHKSSLGVVTPSSRGRDEGVTNPDRAYCLVSWLLPSWGAEQA